MFRWGVDGPVRRRRGSEAELLGLGGCEADVGGLDAGVAGEVGGADAEDFVGVEGLGDGAGDADHDFELAGAVGDALFEGAVEGLKLASHGLELGREVLDLVAGSDRSGDGAEVAGGDAAGGQGEVAQAASGADGGEADEGGGEQGGAEEGDENKGTGSAEGLDGGGPGAFDDEAPTGGAEGSEASDALGADHGAAEEGAGGGLEEWIAGLAGGRDGAAELVEVLVVGDVGGGVDEAEGGVGGGGDEVLKEGAPGGFSGSWGDLDDAEADDGAVGNGGDDCGLAVAGLDDVGESEGVGGTSLLDGCRGWGSESLVELLGRAGVGGSVEEEVGRGGGSGAEVGAEGVGEGAVDWVGEGEGAVGLGLEEGFEAGVLVEEEGEDGDGEQHGGGGDSGQDGDLAGQGAGPAAAGPGWGGLVHGAAKRGRVD